MKMSDLHFCASQHITAQLAALIVAQEQRYTVSTVETKRKKSEMKSNKQTFQRQLLELLQEKGSSTLKRGVELASETGHPVGSPFNALQNMVSIFRKGTSGMPCASDIIGHCLMSLHIVSVDNVLALIIQ